MRKYFCDACKKEIERVNVLEVPCHVYSMKNKAHHVDRELNSVSGRKDCIDLCNKCWNIAHYASIKAIGLDS